MTPEQERQRDWDFKALLFHITLCTIAVVLGICAVAWQLEGRLKQAIAAPCGQEQVK